MVSDDQRLLVRVVDAGSLKAAATQLGADPSTVSRRIARLEDALGVRLLQRSTRRTTPTEAGARYVEGLRRLLQEHDALVADVTGRVAVPTGRLRVTAPVDFGARFVVPVLERLQQDFPTLEVTLDLGSGLLDLRQRNIDVAIRVGWPADSSLRVRRLGVVPRVLVASPCHLERFGRPCTVEALATHPFILYRDGRRTDFTIQRPDGREARVQAPSRLAVNSVTGIRRLVEAGRGVTLGPLWAFEEALAAGTMEALLPDHTLPAWPLSALYAPSPWIPARIRVFVDRMAEAAAVEPALGYSSSPR